MFIFFQIFILLTVFSLLLIYFLKVNISSEMKKKKFSCNNKKCINKMKYKDINRYNNTLCSIFKQTLVKYDSKKDYATGYEYIKKGSKCAIFSMSYNYNVGMYYLFVNSLKKTNYSDDIFMFTNRNSDVNLLSYFKKNYITPLFFEEEWPYYSTQNKEYPITYSELETFVPLKVNKGYYKFAMVRYYLLYAFFNKFGQKYKYGLMADLKDVYFQLHPFSWNIPEGISLFEESRSMPFNKNKANLNWVRRYNYSSYDNYYIINSGQIFFTYPDILYFLKEFNNIINNSENIDPEQAIFNIIYYSKNYSKRKITLFTNYYGPARVIVGDIIYLISDLKQNKTEIRFKNFLDYYENKIVNCDYTIPILIHFYFFLNYRLSIKNANEAVAMLK